MGLEEKYSYFTGGGNLYKHWTGRLQYTEGIREVAETYGGYWLIDLIASYQVYPHVVAEEFHLWLLTVKGNTAVATMQADTDAPVIIKQEIPFTDFPESIRLYVEFGVLKLPSEY